jgi:hypothetical protein
MAPPYPTGPTSRPLVAPPSRFQGEPRQVGRLTNIQALCKAGATVWSAVGAPPQGKGPLARSPAAALRPGATDRGGYRATVNDDGRGRGPVGPVRSPRRSRLRDGKRPDYGKLGRRVRLVRFLEEREARPRHVSRTPLPRMRCSFYSSLLFFSFYWTNRTSSSLLLERSSKKYAGLRLSARPLPWPPLVRFACLVVQFAGSLVRSGAPATPKQRLSGRSPVPRPPGQKRPSCSRRLRRRGSATGRMHL